MQDTPVVVLTVPPDFAGRIEATFKFLLHKLTRGSWGLPPGDDDSGGWKLLLLVIVWVVALLVYAWLRFRFMFAMSVVNLMLAVCIAPMISVEWVSRHPVVRTAVETAIISAFAAFFILQEFGTGLVTVPVLYTTVAVLILEIGGHALEWFKKDFVSRLSQFSKVKTALADRTAFLEAMLRRQQVIYLSVPIGFLLGLQWGLLYGSTDLNTVIDCVIAVLSLSSLFLIGFLIYSFIQMCDPMFTRESIKLVILRPKASLSALGSRLFGNSFTFVAPQPSDDNETWEREFEVAAYTTNLRKTFLFDSLHNVLLLTVFVAILLRLAGTIVSVRQLGFWLLAATFVFSQLPFSIGQKRLQRNALWKYPAVKSVEFGKTLSEVAPLFPPFQLLSSLATTGTGSLLYYVLDETIKNGLKSLVG